MNRNDKYSPSAPPTDLEASPAGRQARMYVHESGWQISIKRGSDRVFCHLMEPEQDYYHRLVDGEIYLHQADERICLRCAVRRGIIATEPRRLRDDAPLFLPETGEPPIHVPGVDED